MSTRASTPASSATLANTEQRSQPVAQDAVIKPSQVQNKNTNSDNALMQPIDGGATPSLLRRKRVLPNLGSAARKRRSSVSKENVDKNPDVPEIRQEEVDVPHKDLGRSNVSYYLITLLMYIQYHSEISEPKFILRTCKKDRAMCASITF